MLKKDERTPERTFQKRLFKQFLPEDYIDVCNKKS